jgi:hypothetical protein
MNGIVSVPFKTERDRVYFLCTYSIEHKHIFRFNRLTGERLGNSTTAPHLNNSVPLRLVLRQRFIKQKSVNAILQQLIQSGVIYLS